MSTEENKAIVRHITEEGWNHGNTALFDEFIAADFIGHFPGSPFHRLEGYKQFYADIHSTFPDVHYTIEDEIAEGDMVVSRLPLGELRGIPPSGKRVTTTGMVIFRFASGKVAEAWYEYDSLGMLEQIGALPTPGQAG
jgi:predicted ester cyclase